MESGEEPVSKIAKTAIALLTLLALFEPYPGEDPGPRATRYTGTSDYLSISDSWHPRPSVLTATKAPVPATSRPKTVQQASRGAKPAPTPRSSVVALGKRMAAKRGWVGRQWDALYALWQAESRWDPNAVNRRSGACGIPQFHPCAGPNGADRHRKRPAYQIADGLAYIARRYGTPVAAYAMFRREGSY